MSSILQQMEDCIRRDTAERGLSASDSRSNALCAGHLAEAAEHLAKHGETTMIVTGFFVPDADVPAGETDGPPGAAILAAALQEVGIDSWIVTDSNCRPGVAAAAEFLQIRPGRIITVDESPETWLSEFIQSDADRSLSHLIAVERVGPSHTVESIARQYSNESSRRIEFESIVPSEHRDCCHNIRGRNIDGHTAPLHQLFERFAEFCPDGRTIGVGDGGNEIGMGGIPWHDIVRRLPSDQAGHSVCRIATDWMILAGVSNWGAQALAAAVLKLRQRLDVMQPWTAEFHERLLEHMVKNGPAVDGITGRAEATVDGLPFITYIQPWEDILRLLD